MKLPSTNNPLVLARIARATPHPFGALATGIENWKRRARRVFLPMITSFFSKKDSAQRKRRPLDETDKNHLETPSVGPTKKARGDASTDEAVQALLASLEDPNGEPSWRRALERHFSSSSFKSLANFVRKERSSKTIYPPADSTWSALNLTPLHQVRVVIVGQDPYHGPGQAHGLCFSVLPGQQIPPSLRNIYKELRQDKAIENFTAPQHGHLVRWAQQGVLMVGTPGRNI